MKAATTSEESVAGHEEISVLTDELAHAQERAHPFGPNERLVAALQQTREEVTALKEQ